MRLIDAEELYKKTAEWETDALEHVGKLNEQEGDETPSLEWYKWNAILGERSAFKYDIMDAPTIDAVPVVRCKDCKHAVPETYYKSWDYKCILFQHAMLAEDYCSHGKRKDGDAK